MINNRNRITTVLIFLLIILISIGIIFIDIEDKKTFSEKFDINKPNEISTFLKTHRPLRAIRHINIENVKLKDFGYGYSEEILTVNINGTSWKILDEDNNYIKVPLNLIKNKYSNIKELKPYIQLENSVNIKVGTQTDVNELTLSKTNISLRSIIIKLIIIFSIWFIIIASFLDFKKKSKNKKAILRMI